MLNESNIRSFLILAQEKSYTNTARRLYLSQQAVSKQMAKLEEDLGCAMFRREQGKLTLTEAGQLFYEAFSRMDAILEEAKHRAGQLDGGRDRELIIGVLDAMVLPPVVRAANRRYRQLYPDVKLSYKNNTTGLRAWLEEGKVDVVFSLAQDCPEEAGFQSAPLLEAREVLAVCAEHPKATDTASYLDFRDEPVLFTSDPRLDPESQSRNLLPPGFEGARMAPKDDFMASSVAAEHMQGVMFLHEGTRLDENPNFRFYPTGRTISIVMAYPAGMKKPCARKYADEVKRQLAADREAD